MGSICDRPPHPGREIDSLDGTLGPDRARTLTTARRVADAVARLRETFDAARLVDVPEPSPLFWQHQAARISELVAGESIQHPRSAWTYAAWAGSAAAVAAAGLMFLVHGLAAGAFFAGGGPSGPRRQVGAVSEPAPRDGSDERAWSVVEDRAAD